MIGMLRGKVWELLPNGLVMDVQGVGYEMTVPNSLLSKLYIGQETVIYTQVVIREDDLSLYGFSSGSEKNLFLTLISVSGIGPKAGMAILSTFDSEQIEQAIAMEDVNLLTRVPGIGKKTAQRLVLELKEKYKDRALKGLNKAESPLSGGSESNLWDALEALMALGYSQEEGKRALQRIEARDALTLEEQIRIALQYLAERL